MISFQQGFEQVMATAAVTPRRETVSLADATGRIAVCTQYSTIDVPGCDNSAMDGYAVRSAEIALGFPNESRRVDPQAADDEQGLGELSTPPCGARTVPDCVAPRIIFCSDVPPYAGK